MLKRFSARNLYNKPLLLTVEALSNITDYVEIRNNTVTWKNGLIADSLEALKLAKDNKELLSTEEFCQKRIVTFIQKMVSLI